jgi:hypothetical protein
MTAPDSGAGDIFGYSVAVSGNTALVGAVFHDRAGNDDAGVAYVFTRSGGLWTLQAELTAGDGVGFGDSVALSGDTAVVGAPYHVIAGKIDAGAAYVFTRSGGSWTAQAKLVAADAAANDRFGHSVALSGDTAVVGAPYRDAAGLLPHAGAAYVFTRSGGSWTPQQTIVATDAADGDQFGHSVAVSSGTALVGAPYRDIAGQADAGAAYVFTRFGGFWKQQARLTATDGAAAETFGYSVSVSGGTALVGANGHAVAGMVLAGAAYVFTGSAGSWTQQAQLLAPDGAVGDQFGRSVALSGGTALVGAPWHDTAGKVDAGAAYMFTRSAGSWRQQTKPIAPDGAAGDQFGRSVALSGAMALGGAPYHDTAGQADAGAAYSFISEPVIAKLKPASGKRGAIVTVTGTGFGATRGSSSVTFGGKKCTKYVSWSASRIRCIVPAQAKYSVMKLQVTTAGGVSNAMSFTVRR